MSILEPKQVIVRTWQYQVFRDDLGSTWEVLYL